MNCACLCVLSSDIQRPRSNSPNRSFYLIFMRTSDSTVPNVQCRYFFFLLGLGVCCLLYNLFNFFIVYIIPRDQGVVWCCTAVLAYCCQRFTFNSFICILTSVCSSVWRSLLLCTEKIHNPLDIHTRPFTSLC